LKKMTLVFNNDDCRIFINSKPKNVGSMDKIIENPDLSRVVGISPSFWKLVDGQHVFPMTEEERRLKQKKHHNTVRDFKIYQPQSKWLSVVFSFAMIVIGAVIMFFLIKKGIM